MPPTYFDFTQDDKKYWKEMVEEFRTHIYPMLAEHSISFPDALQMFISDKLCSEISVLLDNIQIIRPDGEDESHK